MNHESINQKYGNQAIRLTNINRSAEEDVVNQNHSNLSQSVSPGTIFYSRSPEHDREEHQHQIGQQHHSDGTTNNTHANTKYQDSLNGSDSLTDFVSFVCQDTQNSTHVSNANTINRNSKLQSSYPQYSSMLPPPPLPPMARPVAIIRSRGDLPLPNSPPNSATPPHSGTQIPSPHHHDHVEAETSSSNMITISQSSPPLSPQSQIDTVNGRFKGLTRITSPYLTNTGRDYAFNHFHPQSSQV